MMSYFHLRPALFPGSWDLGMRLYFGHAVNIRGGVKCIVEYNYSDEFFKCDDLLGINYLERGKLVLPTL